MTATIDRSSDILVIDQIGKTRYRTPEGYLLCEGVRISSTKPTLYRPDEMPEITPDKGMIVMHRDPAVLFSAETLASFQGKDVTNSHPDALLGPATWRDSAVGTVLDPRQGDGAEADYLLADLLIKDEAAIAAIESGLREVSCGYDSDREEVKPGLGRFIRIIGNHVALVDKGRCGPSCAIGDQETMAIKRTPWDRLRTAFKANDEAAFNEEMEAAKGLSEGETSGGVVVHVHNAPAGEPVPPKVQDDAEAPEAAADPMQAILEAIAAIGSRLDKLEAPETAEAEEPEAETTDETPDEKAEEKEDKEADKEPTMDRAGFQVVASKAEILAPGVKLPTLDAKAAAKDIGAAAHSLRKAAMDRAFSDDKRKGFVIAILGDKPNLSKMTADAMAMAFNGAAELARASANAPRIGMDHQNFRQGPMTAAKLQEVIVANRAKGK